MQQQHNPNGKAVATQLNRRQQLLFVAGPGPVAALQRYHGVAAVAGGSLNAKYRSTHEWHSMISTYCFDLSGQSSPLISIQPHQILATKANPC